MRPSHTEPSLCSHELSHVAEDAVLTRHVRESQGCGWELSLLSCGHQLHGQRAVSDPQELPACFFSLRPFGSPRLAIVVEAPLLIVVKARFGKLRANQRQQGLLVAVQNVPDLTV